MWVSLKSMNRMNNLPLRPGNPPYVIPPTSPPPNPHIPPPPPPADHVDYCNPEIIQQGLQNKCPC